MKWFLLIFLVSCGQDKMPKALDLGDDDGDQIINEIDERKNVSDVEEIGEIDGELSFINGNVIKQEQILKLSNKRDLLSESLDVLTRSESKIVIEDTFSEWSKVKIDTRDKIFELADRIFELNFTFLSTNSVPDFLIFIKGNEYIKLGDFRPTMKLKLNMSDLDLLLKGKAYLAFGKSTKVQHYIDSRPIQQTIREKTYRIFLNDGQKASILSVAKNYSFNEFLQDRNIKSVINFKDINPFQYSESSDQWFYRDLPGGEKVLVQTGHTQLLSSYLKNFKKFNFELKRANGSAVNNLKIEKKINSMIQLKIRATQTKRTFKEFSENVRHMTGGGREGSPDKWTCINYHRVIDTEVQVQPSMDDVLTNLMLKFDGITAALSQVEHTISLKDDEIGQYLLVTLPNLPQSLEVYLQSKANNTFVTTGQYDLKCETGYPVRGGISVVPTNAEGHLTLTLEAYVEKLD